MKKAIFLTGSPQILDSVYRDAKERIAASVDLEPNVFFGADVRNEPGRFHDTACIFSTWGMPVFTQEEIRAAFPSLEAVFYGAGSVQHFARPFLAEGIRVFSAWTANAVPVAQFTAAQTILALKGYFHNIAAIKKDRRAGMEQRTKPGHGVYGGTVAVLGAGMIGKLVINLLKPHRVKILVFDPFLSDAEAEKMGVEKGDLAEVMARAGVVTNHLANNEQTRKLVDAAAIAAMPDNAVFINTGRGATVDEEALIRELRARPTLFALLDVTHPEPPEPDSPLWEMDNVLLSSHLAGAYGSDLHLMAEAMAEACEAVLRGEPSRSEVTASMLATMA